MWTDITFQHFRELFLHILCLHILLLLAKDKFLHVRVALIISCVNAVIRMLLLWRLSHTSFGHVYFASSQKLKWIYYKGYLIHLSKRVVSSLYNNNKIAVFREKIINATRTCWKLIFFLGVKESLKKECVERPHESVDRWFWSMSYETSL